MNRAVCYTMSRALYRKVGPTIRSLLAHNRIDRLYLLIEDDEFPMRLPECAYIINTSGQPYFRPGGPNWRQPWTHMVLMRAALSKFLPDEERVLSLDVDTIIRGDIGALWDMDLTGKYLAGVREPLKSQIYGRLYVNYGVVMLNLEALRDGMDDRIIEALNTRRYDFPEQDCVNELCAGRIMELPGMYNATPYTTPTDTVLIKHYAANPAWWNEEEVQAWR